MKLSGTTLKTVMGALGLMSAASLTVSCQVGAPVAANGSGNQPGGVIVIPSVMPTPGPGTTPTIAPSTTPTTSPSVTPTAAPTTTPTTEPSSGTPANVNLLANVTTQGRFSTLASILNREDMADIRTLLSNVSTQYTLFAPNDQAFAKMDATARDALLNNSGELHKVIMYHVVTGLLPTTELVKIQHTESLLDNNPIVVSIDAAGHVKINDSATLTGMTDVQATNGILQEIDTVLTPPNPSGMPTATPTPVPTPTVTPSPTPAPTASP